MNAHLERALLLVEQSRYELAEKELRQVLAEDPGEAIAHSVLALCLCERKDYKGATEEAELAIHNAPAMPYAHYVLCRIMYARNRFAEARAAIMEAIRLNPEDADYFAQLAQIHLNERRWPDALEAAEKGLQHDSEHVGCANTRAVALVKLGRRAEAGAAIGAALARQPEDATTHANQGWTLLEQNQPEKAMEHFREALRLEPNNEWARQGIVEALKARYFIYSLMLRYFLWTAKLSRRGGMIFVIGGYLAYRGLWSLADAQPALAPFIWPVLGTYIAFCLMTWIAASLFNLVLRLNRFGRLALSPTQIRSSNWVGAFLFLTLSGLVSWLAFGWDHGFWIMLCCGIMVLPITVTFGCASGWPRNCMAVYTCALGILAAVSIGITFIPITTKVEFQFWESTLEWTMTVLSYGVLLSGFAASYLSSVVVKK